MLSGIEARGRAAGEAAADRARARIAQALGDALPGVTVTVDRDGIVLAGRIDVDDPRLRWIGSLF